jgi:hypothetical protein
MESVRGGDTHCVTAVTAVGQAEPSLGLAVASASSSVGSRSDETVADATLASGHTEAADPLRGVGSSGCGKSGSQNGSGGSD